ncbi:crossover junction endodeoxyribonuclease RuvC [Candidatus Campbellbacteria bacterium]|nr:MAG: crossover junction endodeoxyribonuclease RuvC [Candidatus Campbellbacteria bacterium]
MITLGIDPGYDRLGIALLEGDRQKQVIIFSECFETCSADDFETRLHAAVSHVRDILHTYTPDNVALETLFFSNNQKTAMHVAETRGALLFAITDAHISAHQYAPQAIKVAVAGSGRGSKDDIARMLHKLLSIPNKKIRDDEYDAIAVALTHMVSCK